jgi:hypothetical protein
MSDARAPQEKPISLFILPPRARASRRRETQAPLNGTQQHANAANALGLLGMPRKRPHRGRTGDQLDELAPPHARHLNPMASREYGLTERFPICRTNGGFPPFSAAHPRCRERPFLPHCCHCLEPVAVCNWGGNPSYGSRIRSAPKWCSRQAEFHHILGRRSPVGLAWQDERSAGRAAIGGHSGG